MANLGQQTLSGQVLPNNVALVDLETYYPFVEETEYPYFYFGVAFLVLMALTILLPYLFALRKTNRVNSVGLGDNSSNGWQGKSE